jgi:hypothetical protein
MGQILKHVSFQCYFFLNMSKFPSSVEESLQFFVELLSPCSLAHQGSSSKVDLVEHYLNIKLLKWKHKEK